MSPGVGVGQLRPVGQRVGPLLLRAWKQRRHVRGRAQEDRGHTARGGGLQSQSERERKNAVEIKLVPIRDLAFSRTLSTSFDFHPLSISETPSLCPQNAVHDE